MGTTKWALLHAAYAVAPLAFLVMITSVLSAGGQGGIYLAPKLLKPKMDRLNPLKGIKRMFGGHGVWQLIKSLLKLAVLALVDLPVGAAADPTADGGRFAAAAGGSGRHHRCGAQADPVRRRGRAGDGDRRCGRGAPAQQQAD